MQSPQSSHIVPRMKDGQRVKVYRNLHKKCWSVVSMEGDNYGIVVAHLPSVQLRDCQFRVSEKGRQRVIREKRKNVHAYVLGFVSADAQADEEVTYNPYRFATFVKSETSEPVTSAQAVRLDDTMKVYARI